MWPIRRKAGHSSKTWNSALNRIMASGDSSLYSLFNMMNYSGSVVHVTITQREIKSRVLRDIYFIQPFGYMLELPQQVAQMTHFKARVGLQSDPPGKYILQWFNCRKKSIFYLYFPQAGWRSQKKKPESRFEEVRGNSSCLAFVSWDRTKLPFCGGEQ